ncbi:nucleopolyhedrovirus P10 family protein [Streptomyces sp. TRM 70361]|uniref:nucleopolyhedrovirus P10 family protein n=1 Tax=Streptomyces sp. TRM 70361 TaxID=3116553 RepID=UPI002E7ACF5E|nr:nucleopolyhedrovirus P10 family protein [Streptomyces sp. TRM 70361]MEE1941535.1 nucleopolyhedrovirus P10 family protein [Streptomyces sp. TRM 70361]
MVADQLTQAVRRQLGLGRLLPLGEAADGAWLTERAAAGVLRRAVDGLPGVRPGRLRLAPAGPDTAAPAVPAPPSALPPGPVRIEADFAAGADEPLPVAAERLRTALAEAADSRLGLAVAAVDLRITGLLEGPDDTAAPEGAPEADPGDDSPGDGDTTGAEAAERETADTAEAAGGPEAAVRAAALAVPGVAHLAPLLGGAARPVRITETTGPGGPSGRHVQIQLAVAGGHRALDVVREVRDAVARTADGAPGPVTVAVVVTEVTEVTEPPEAADQPNER